MAKTRFCLQFLDHTLLLNIKLNLVPTCPKNRKNRGFLRSSDVWDSYDQCEHPIPDIRDGRRFLRRDRTVVFLLSRYCPRRSPTSAISTMSVNMKFACLGRSWTIGDFYDECKHEICLSGTSGMLDFVFTCYQSLISVNYKRIILSTAAKN